MSTKIKNELYARLGPVRARLRKIPRRRGAAAGLLAGAVVVFVVGLGRLVLPVPVLATIPLEYLAAGVGAVLVISTVLGATFSRGARPADWHAAARAVDAQCGLHQRTISALEFLESDQLSDGQHLQVADTIRRLGQLDSSAVVPLPIPRKVVYSVALMVAGAVLMMLPPVISWDGEAAEEQATAQVPAESLVEARSPKEPAKPLQPLDVGWSPAPRNPAVVSIEQLAEPGPGDTPPSGSVAPLGRTDDIRPAGHLPPELGRMVRDYFKAIRTKVEYQPIGKPSEEPSGTRD